jgi:hypothetical protein
MLRPGCRDQIVTSAPTAPYRPTSDERRRRAGLEHPLAFDPFFSQPTAPMSIWAAPHHQRHPCHIQPLLPYQASYLQLRPNSCDGSSGHGLPTTYLSPLIWLSDRCTLPEKLGSHHEVPSPICGQDCCPPSSRIGPAHLVSQACRASLPGYCLAWSRVTKSQVEALPAESLHDWVPRPENHWSASRADAAQEPGGRTRTPSPATSTEGRRRRRPRCDSEASTLPAGTMS